MRAEPLTEACRTAAGMTAPQPGRVLTSATAMPALNPALSARVTPTRLISEPRRKPGKRPDGDGNPRPRDHRGHPARRRTARAAAPARRPGRQGELPARPGDPPAPAQARPGPGYAVTGK